jgi:hypothetical protein
MAQANRIEGIGGGSRGSGGITGSGGKNVNPVYKESFPPKPPAGKPIDLKNPPKVPMGKEEPKPPHVPEVKAPAPKTQNPPFKPMVLPGRGKFTGNLAPYNWTGK